jgi:hypothetical protein
MVFAFLLVVNALSMFRHLEGLFREADRRSVLFLPLQQQNAHSFVEAPSSPRWDVIPLTEKLTVDRSASPPSDPKVLMISYVFGEDAVNKLYLRMFVESARWAGIDVAIVGHPGVPFALPPNVKHIPVTWDELLNRIKDRVLNGEEPGNLRGIESGFYKVIDFKPLFAHLFPEEVKGYDWWGHLDNDMVLGNVRHFLSRDKLSRYDIISSIAQEYTVGPFMLYRNTPIINELFRLAERPLSEIFDAKEVRVFDEWGGDFAGRNHSAEQQYGSSMAGIVDYHHKRLGIRWLGGIPCVWDGFCMGKIKGTCSECKYSGHFLTQDCFGKRPCPPRVAFCHFQYSKKTMEASLARNERMKELLHVEQYLLNFQEGFMFLNTTAR